MAEGEVKPQHGRDEAPTLSLFEWTLERAREENLAGVPR